LRKLVDAGYAQQLSDARDAAIRISLHDLLRMLVDGLPMRHRSELDDLEPAAISAHPHLPKEDRAWAIQPNQKRNAY